MDLMLQIIQDQIEGRNWRKGGKECFVNDGILPEIPFLYVSDKVRRRRKEIYNFGDGPLDC